MTRPVASLSKLVSAQGHVHAHVHTHVHAHMHAPMHAHVHDQASVLHRHLQQCAKARGRWFGVALLAERIRGLVAPRLATTVALGALTVGLVLHWL